MNITRTQAKNAALVGLGIGALGLIGGGMATWFVARSLRRTYRKLSPPRLDFQGKVVLITGGSRGLGLALAQEFASRGAQLALCARNQAELNRASELVRQQHDVRVETFAYDLSVAEQVQQLASDATARFGRIDVWVNNAGTISVGPIQNQTIEDFQSAMNINFWATVHGTFAVLPQMLARASGNIVNITSIGGKVSIPHLLPYSCSKFAAVDFSEGLRAEIKDKGVRVTTVCPGLMRTGSHLNAQFKGKHSEEFTWFSLGTATPLTSVAAHRAARQIVNATRSGRGELIVGWQAELLARAHGLAPELTTEILTMVNRLLPKASTDAQETKSGSESQNLLTRSPLLAMPN